jgi:hypothetical protein
MINATAQFAVSGETESFGSNNLMGQWLSAIGGYTVEQVGRHVIRLHLPCLTRAVRLLSQWSNSFWYRIHTRLRYLDRLYASEMASARVHVLLLHSCCDLHPRVE